MKLVVLSACVAAACALELSADEHALLESIKLKGDALDGYFNSRERRQKNKNKNKKGNVPHGIDWLRDTKDNAVGLILDGEKIMFDEAIDNKNEWARPTDVQSLEQDYKMVVNPAAYNTVAEVKASLLNSIATASNTVKENVETQKSSIEERLAETATAVDTKIEAAAEELKADQAKLEEEINAKGDEIEKASQDQVAELTKQLDAGLASADEELESLKAALESQTTTMTQMYKCGVAGQAYDAEKKKCVNFANQPARFVKHARLHQRNWHGGGHIPHADFTFTKIHDNTAIRVKFYDNIRIGAYTGHTCHTNFRLQIDGRSCTDPGDINFHKHAQSGRHGGRYQNDHDPTHLTGICRKTDQGNIGKGNHQLRIHIYYHNGCGLYSGWDNQQRYYEVEEVLWD